MFSDSDGKIWTAPLVIARQPGGKLRYTYRLERKPGEIWLELRGNWVRILEGDFAALR